MSQTFDRAPPRFSRRQVTKRKFNILGSPNVLQNVQTYKDNKIDAKINRTDTEANRIRTQRQKLSAHKLKAQRSRSTRKRRNLEDDSSSPHTEVQEQNENEVGRDPDTDSNKDVGQDESTPQNQQKLGPADDEQTPGDVSVTFLASTPKPGRPQLSRRRPMSPVRESSAVPLGSYVATSTEEQRRKGSYMATSTEEQRRKQLKDNSVTNKLQVEQASVPSQRDQSPRKQSPQKQSPRKQSPWKQSPRKSPQKQAAGASINEMIASSNQSRLENKRKNSEIHKNLSVNNDSLRTTGRTKRQKVSVPLKDISVTRSILKTGDVTAGGKTIIDNSRTETGGTESPLRNKSRNRSKNVATTTVGATELSKQLQKGNNVSRTRLDKNVRSDENDVTVRNHSARLSLSSRRRKSAVNTKLQALDRGEDSTDTILPDQTVIVWETEGQKRTRTDLIDLDVVLNTMTETLAARMYVYDADEEQSAVHLLEKYLTQDITHMIHGVQTVAELQSKIKKCGQSIKQKQKSLMSLQKDRVELEEKCQPAKKMQERNENMATINQFLKDLGKVIDMC